MTLGEVFNFLSKEPFWLLSYFIGIPLLTLLLNGLIRSRGGLTPWKWLYSAIVFLVAIPGIMAATFDVYLFLFERRSILNMDLIIQVLPILSFVLTLWIISKNVSLDLIPGFGKVSGLVVMIIVALGVMWLLDRTRVIFAAFTHMPFQYVAGLFVGVLAIIRLGWSRLTR